MAKKKNLSKEDIQNMFMDYVLKNGKSPPNVYIFSKEYNFEEPSFYQFFGSFISVEKSIFATIFDNTLKVLEKNDDYSKFDNRNKLLSFYFTFFENLTANRSYVFTILSQNSEKMKTLSILSDLRKKFIDFIKSLEISSIPLNDARLEKIQARTIKESAWAQLLITLKFWMSDESPSFEKTDVFIEKSVNTSFDLIDNTPIRNIIDLGKFLVKEKFNMSI
jgi:hypothetical protein